MIKKRKYFLIAVLLLSYCNFCIGQQRVVDSLNIVLKTTISDTTRLQLYFALCDACDVKDNLKYAQPAIQLINKLAENSKDKKQKLNFLQKKAFAYNYFMVYYFENKQSDNWIKVRNEQLSIYKELNDTVLIVNTLYSICNFYKEQGNYPKALETVRSGIDLSKNLNYKYGIAGFSRQLGDIYKDQNDTIQAIQNYNFALTVLENLKDTNTLCDAYLKTGISYGSFHNVSKALYYFNKAMKVYVARDDKNTIRATLNVIGLMYLENNDWDNALINFENSLLLSKKLGDKSWIRGILGNIGNVYLQKGNISKALDYQLQSLKLAEELNNSLGWSYGNIAKTYFQMKDYKRAKEYCDKSFKIIRKEVSIRALSELELLATKIDSAKGDGFGAFEHYKAYITLSNKLISDDVKKMAAQEKFQKEFDEQKAKAKAEQDKKDAVAEGEKNKQALIRNAFIVGFVFLLLIALLILKGYRNKQKANLIIIKQKQDVEKAKQIIEHQKREVDEKQKDILDSIHYAKRIQQSLMSTEKYISKTLNRLKK